MFSLLLFALLGFPLCGSIPVPSDLPSNNAIVVAPGMLNVQPVQQILGLDDQESRRLWPTIVPLRPHGAFVTHTTSTTTPTSTTAYESALRTAQYPVDLCRRYALGWVALGLLLLVPVTLGIVALAERTGWGCASAEDECDDKSWGRHHRCDSDMREELRKREERWWGRLS